MGGRIAVVAVYVAAFIVLSWPLATDPAGSLPSIGWAATGTQVGEDQLHIMWTLAWGAHALTTEPSRFFDGNAFHPELGIISQSEHMVGNQLAFTPVWLATDNPVLAMNAIVATSLVLSALAMHLLVRSWTGSTSAAYVAGLAFAFAPWRFFMLSLPQLLPVMYLPVIVLALDRVAVSASGRAAIVAGLALALQTLTSYYLGYIAFALAGLYLLADLLGRGVRRSWRTWAALAVALVIIPLALVLPITLPYLQSQLRGELAWTLPAGAIEGLRATGMGAVVAGKTWSYVGGGTLLLAVLGVLQLGRAWRVDRHTGVRLLALLLMALAGIVLAAGPAGLAGGWVALFGPLARVVPGFGNVRDPMRFLILTSFATSALAGFAVSGAERWSAGSSVAMRSIVSVLGVSAVLAALVTVPRPRPRPLVSGADVPAVYHWLARHGAGGPLLELPIGAAMGLERKRSNAKAMYFSTFHWLPTLNGHTSYPPASYQLFEGYAARLPADEALRRLARDTGLRWILVHARRPWRAGEWATLAGVEKRGTFPHEGTHEDHLYEVAPALRGDAVKRRFTRARTLDGNPVAPVSILRGRVRIDGIAARVPRATERLVTITVDNDGSDTWPSTAIDPADRITLLVRWTDRDGGAVAAHQRVLLPADVAGRDSVSFTAWLRGIRRPGPYRVTAHLVRGTAPPSEDAAWRRLVTVTRR